MINILVTGFAAFPGCHTNPCLALLAALEKKRRRLARLGIVLELHTLPVVYAGLDLRLANLVAETQPDAILHFGLAGRRWLISVETRASNHVSLIRPDAAGAYPKAAQLRSGAPQTIKARLPARGIAAAWRQAGIGGVLSNNAGDYVCNASLYYALTGADVACLGFIHIPPSRPRMARRSADASRGETPPSFSDLVTASEIALMIIARTVRQSRLTSARALDHRAGQAAGLMDCFEMEGKE
jgi:pyroglutamyl-peptidase